MHFLNRVRDALADARLDANLLAFYGLAVAVIIVALILRRLLATGGNRIAAWAGEHWLGAVGEEASRRARTWLFWLTLLSVLAVTVGGAVFHLKDGDVRVLFQRWIEHFTLEDLFRLGGRALGVVAAFVVAWCAVRLLRRWRPRLESQAAQHIGSAHNQEQLKHWFTLFESYSVFFVRLGAVWAMGQIVGVHHLVNLLVGFVFRVLTILAVARLLILACRALSHTTSQLGDRHLTKGKLEPYWDRIKRLYPFGEHCFEAAIYVLAATLCVMEIHDIADLGKLGPKIVACIGILFGTRVVIELSQVLLNEAFGLYKDEDKVDQKARTLVPLLHSVCQYLLYFGAGVEMLKVLEVDTLPVLAAASLLGLAVGLGAQSLVTDVVSGFFILFEGQYLVGDFVQIGDATGVVETVGIRVTEVRDGQGKLYIIPNGQIKTVVNYSKGYINAVVDVKVPTGTDLEVIFRAMTEAGVRLRQTRREVLAATEIHGLVELSTSDMTVRAVTKVQPGKHAAMQNEYRRLLKQILDQKDAPQKPATLAA